MICLVVWSHCRTLTNYDFQCVNGEIHPANWIISRFIFFDIEKRDGKIMWQGWKWLIIDFIIFQPGSSGYSSYNGGHGLSSGTATSTSISPMYGSTSSATAMSGLSSTTLTNTSSMFYPSSGGTASDLGLNLGQSSAGLRSSTLSAPVSMMPPLSPLSLPALPLDALNSVGKF